MKQSRFSKQQIAFGGLMPSEIKRADENAKLEWLVADLSLDKAMLQDVVKRKL